MWHWNFPEGRFTAITWGIVGWRLLQGSWAARGGIFECKLPDEKLEKSHFPVPSSPRVPLLAGADAGVGRVNCRAFSLRRTAALTSDSPGPPNRRGLSRKVARLNLPGGLMKHAACRAARGRKATEFDIDAWCARIPAGGEKALETSSNNAREGASLARRRSGGPLVGKQGGGGPLEGHRAPKGAEEEIFNRTYPPIEAFPEKQISFALKRSDTTHRGSSERGKQLQGIPQSTHRDPSTPPRGCTAVQSHAEAAMGSTPEWPPYRETALRRDSQREFIDWAFLCRRPLDSPAAALDYFCLTPFYAEVRAECGAAAAAAAGGVPPTPASQTAVSAHGVGGVQGQGGGPQGFFRQHLLLNERLRLGEAIDIARTEGLVFEVVQHNLQSIDALAPPAPPQHQGQQQQDDEAGAAAALLSERCQYYRTKAIFLIALVERRQSMHGVQQQQQRRIYSVVAGRVYRQPPLRDSMIQRLAEATEDLSCCADLLLLQLCSWSLPSGFSWRAPLSRRKQLLAAAAASKYCGDTLQQASQQEDQEATNISDTTKSTSRVKVVYKRPPCAAALRVLQEETKYLELTAQQHEAQERSLMEEYNATAATAAKEAAALQQLQHRIGLLRAALLQAAPNASQAAALLQQLTTAAANIPTVAAPAEGTATMASAERNAE
ncbi:uncharacterized protein LOC34624074 [Cyclospora cayetanensis]|uniref:Uncharacterized protein LOC34624074 n=1 Tax=Cyclospora cayetanensis TaxID=88456 RepID=A0A6P6RZU4_9EIME|nr:uncharacterized protein LOC34624074 [Cyclospora cayetanensis]